MSIDNVNWGFCRKFRYLKGKKQLLVRYPTTKSFTLIPDFHSLNKPSELFLCQDSGQDQHGLVSEIPTPGLCIHKCSRGPLWTRLFLNYLRHSLLFLWTLECFGSGYITFCFLFPKIYIGYPSVVLRVTVVYPTFYWI